MKSTEALLLGGVLLGGILLAGRPRRATPLPAPPRPLPPIPQPLPDAAVEPSRLEELLAKSFAGSEPEPGMFYQVKPTDQIDRVAEAVLRFGRNGWTPTYAMVLDYIYCMSSSAWNLDRYGSPSTSKSFPNEYRVPGINLGLRAAFLPRNAPAAKLMAEGVMPPRTVHDKTARGLGEHTEYGLIWLPPVSPQDLDRGIVTCAPFSWEDGSSSINPNPELLALLEVAA